MTRKTHTIAYTALITLTFASLYIGYNSFSPCSNNEVLWKVSPGKKFKAVIVESDCWVTTTPNYEVKIREYDALEGGTTVAILHNSHLNADSYGVNACREGDNHLNITYLSSNKTILIQNELQINGHEITISYTPGHTDKGAPGGTMINALQNHSYTGTCGTKQ